MTTEQLQPKWYLQVRPDTNGLELVKTHRQWSGYQSVQIPNPAEILRSLREVYYPVGIRFEQ